MLLWYARRQWPFKVGYRNPETAEREPTILEPGDRDPRVDSCDIAGKNDLIVADSGILRQKKRRRNAQAAYSKLIQNW